MTRDAKALFKRACVLLDRLQPGWEPQSEDASQLRRLVGSLQKQLRERIKLDTKALKANGQRKTKTTNRKSS